MLKGLHLFLGALEVNTIDAITVQQHYMVTGYVSSSSMY